MTQQAYKAVKKQYRVYAKYKNRNHPAYITASDRAKNLIKTARNNFEVKLAAKIKEDKKSFYAYLRSRTKTRTSPVPICSPNSSSPLSDKETANEFNKYFSSVFTEEDTSSIPQSTISFPYPEQETLSNIVISEDIIIKLLGKLRNDKASGADNILPRLLKGISSSIVSPLTIHHI